MSNSRSGVLLILGVDPTHPYWRMATTIEWTDAQRARDRKHWEDRKKKVEEKLLKDFDELEVINQLWRVSRRYE